MELVKWNKAKQAIAEAKSIDEVKEIRDKAQAMKAYAKQVGESLGFQNDICEIKLRAERRMGEMLKEMPVRRGKSKMNTHDGESFKTDVVKDLGIKHYERYEKIADLPEETFESIIEETKEAEKELTEALMLKTVKIIERETKIKEQIEELESQPPRLPDGKFDCIVIDPPWKYDRKYDPDTSRVANPYPEMSQEELLKLEIPAKDNCIMWLWTTNSFMRDAYELLEEWGFAPKTILTWDKVNMGVGYWLRNVTEHCILAVKGSPVWNNKAYTTLITEKRSEHSVKPESFYNMVDKICYGRKLDYFARKKRDGWEVFGDEIQTEKMEE